MAIIPKSERNFMFKRLKNGMFLQARNPENGQISVLYYVLEKSESRATMASYVLFMNKFSIHEMTQFDWDMIVNVWRTSESVTKSEYKQIYITKLFENL